ncbi:MAG: hypothetical protein DI629_03480 [Mesorhizobium amorphae]|nr:MAG: hypothetical protein DI629_03480 [Mesorhizobium amorphae]
MTKTLLIALAAPVAALPADAAGGAWVQLCPAGSFQARDGRGPFEAGHGEALQAIVDRTKSIAGATELVIDYDHQTVFGARDGVGGTAKAAGWVKELQVRDDGIWGRVEWTAAAAEAIRAQEYRYLSPVLLQSKATGKVLAIRMAALTNTPALDLAQVAASADLASLSTEQFNEEPPMKKVLSALGLADDAGEDAALSAVNKLLSGSTAIAQAAGLQAGAEPTAVIAAFAAKAKPDPTEFVPFSVVSELQTQVKALTDAGAASKAEAAVALAIQQGKLSPGQRDWGLDLAKADLAKFEAYAAGAPTLTKQQTSTKAATKEGGGTVLDATQLEAARALGMKPEAYAATLAAEAAEAEVL